jgi:diguanylate cyclase (GGDEF)-like protein
MNNSLFDNLPYDFNNTIINAITSNLHESIYFKDLNSKFMIVSQFMANYFNLESIEDVIGKSDFDFFTRQHAQQAYEDEQMIIRTKQPILGKIEMETWENEMISYVVSSKYPLYDSQGNIIGTWGHSINMALSNENNSDMKIPKAKAIEQSLETNSTIIDSLTGLRNVKAFYEFMNLFYQDAMNSLSLPEKEHYLILIDLKDFKNINKEYGHNYGNQAIVFIGNLIAGNLIDHSELFRYGGDKYAILVKHQNFDQIMEFCSGILAKISKTRFTYEGFSTKINACIGLSRFRESLPFGNIHDIINQADKRLFEAKIQQHPAIIYNNSYRY